MAHMAHMHAVSRKASIKLPRRPSAVSPPGALAPIGGLIRISCSNVNAVSELAVMWRWRCRQAARVAPVCEGWVPWWWR